MANEAVIKKIDALLRLNSSNEEIIEISLSTKIYEINFTKDDQSYLRDFFKDCIDALLKDSFELEFKSDGSVKNAVIIKVAEEYINDLNSEIKNCITEINKNTKDE